MPIDFQAPQPFAPGVAQAAGAAQAEQQNTGMLAGLYAQAAQARSAAYNRAAAEEADRFAQNARVGSSLGEQAQQSADELQFRRDALAASRAPSARDVFEAQVGEVARAQSAQLQTWAHQQDFTFQDNLDLQRHQYALSEVMQANRDGIITDAERDDQLKKLKTGIDTLKDRQQAAIAKQQEAHAEMYLGQARLAARAEQESINLEKSLIESGEQYLVLPGDGPRHERIVIKNPKTGEWYNPLQKNRTAGSGARFADDSGAFSYKKAYPEADKEALAAYPVQKEEVNGKTVDVNQEKRNTYRQDILNREKAKHEAAMSGGGSSGQIDRGAGAAVPDKPFGSDDQASPAQRAQVETWATGREQIAQLPIPDQLKAQYTASSYVMDALLRKYGSVSQQAAEKFDPVDRANYEQARAAIARVKAVSFSNPAPQSPYGGPVGGWRDRVKFKPYR